MNRTPAAIVPGSVRVRSRGVPCLWFTRLPLHELVELLCERHFPRLHRRTRVNVQFATQDALVLVEMELPSNGEGDGPITLSFHAVLNHAATPVEVFGALAKRELAKLDRTDALRAPFAALCPEERFADAWIDHFLGPCLRRADTGDGEPREVLRRWNELWLRPRPLPPALRLELARVETELLRFVPG